MLKKIFSLLFGRYEFAVRAKIFGKGANTKEPDRPGRSRDSVGSTGDFRSG